MIKGASQGTGWQFSGRRRTLRLCELLGVSDHSRAARIDSVAIGLKRVILLCEVILIEALNLLDIPTVVGRVTGDYCQPPLVRVRRALRTSPGEMIGRVKSS
jgi:hypothetical protein